MSQHVATRAPAKPAAKAAPAAALRRNPPSLVASQAGQREDAGFAASLSAAAAANGGAPPPPRLPTPPWQSDFSGLALQAPPSTSVHIHDDNPARALATQRLLAELCPRLGLDPARLDIRVNREAESRSTARGAAGVNESGRLFLHPALYAPEQRSGRALLAHEAVHSAQRTQARQGRLDEVELEAEQLAWRFANDLPLWQPRQGLAPHWVVNAPAADGSAGIAAATAPPPPALAVSVVNGRSREIAAIKNLLSGLWISDGDVSEVMEILDGLDFAVARAVVFALGRGDRYALADNVNAVHIQGHRRSVLACYDALDHDQFGAIDTDVLEALPISGYSPEERLAALHTLKGIGASKLNKLLQSDNRIAIKRLALAPAISPSEEQEIRDREKEAAAKEAKQAESRAQILAYATDTTVDTLLGTVREALRPATDAHHSEPHTHPERALEALVAALGNASRFTFVAEKMDAEGLTELLLGELPSSAFSDSKPHTDTLLKLLEARLPTRNLAYIEGLLSYGVFDWAVRDYEAVFAYRLIRLLTLDLQYRFRQRDNGKWFLRLMNNLPEGFREKEPEYHDIEVRRAGEEDLEQLKQEGIDVKDGLYDAGLRYQKKKQQAATSDALIDLKKAFRKADKNGFPRAVAEDLHHQLAVLGNPDLRQSKFTPGDNALREAVVRELDALGYIEKLFAALPESFLFAEASREATVKIMLSRDAARAQGHARELVSRGFTDWMVKDHEAYLAFLIVKALPDDERQNFIANDPDSWSRINAEMSEDMRRSHALNMYVGDKAGLDRAGVLGQLAQSSSWTAENASVLAGLVNMAIAMTEHRFAFERSKEFAAYKVTALQGMVKTFRLYDEINGPKEYTPEILKGTRWYEEGIFDSLRTIGKGLVFLWNNDLLLVKRSVGANKLDLTELQGVAGGDLGGLHLANPADTAKDPKAPKPDPDANKLDLHIDLGAHALSLWLPELLIDTSNIQTADSTIQTGAMRLKGLRIEAAYDSEQFEQPTAATLIIDSLEINDLLLINRASLAAVTRLLLQTLRLAAGTTDTSTPSTAKPRGGWYFPIPFLKTIGTLIYYLFKFKGWGTETPKTNAAHGIEQIKAAELSFGNLLVEGLSTSGGQNVKQIKVSDFALRVGLNKATQTRAQIGSLEQRIKALDGKPGKEATVTELRKQKGLAETDLASLIKDEKRVLEIQQLILHGGLSKDEQEPLQAELDRINLEAKGGAFIDVGRVEASGLTGTVATDKPIVLDNIHGEADSAALASGLGLGVVTDAELVKRVIGGEQRRSLIEQAGDAKLRLEIEEFQTGKLEIGGGKLLSSQELAAQIKELDAVKATLEFSASYRELERLKTLAERYEQYAQLGVSALTAGQLADFRSVRAELLKKPALVIESIALTRAHLDVSLATGRVGFGADEARVKGIYLASRNLSIAEFYGKNLEAGANASGGLSGWLQARKNLTGADAKADLLRFSGVLDGKTGIGVDSLTITDFGASVDRNGRNASATLKAKNIEAQGVNFAFTERLLRVQLEQLLAKPADKLGKAEVLRIKSIEFLLRDYTRIQGLLKDSGEEIAAGSKDGRLHQQWAQQEMKEWQRNVEVKKLSVRDLNLKVSGLGDILDDNYRFASAKKSGITFAGGGPDGQIISGATIATVYQNQPWAAEKKKAKGKSTSKAMGKHKGAEPEAEEQPEYREGYENQSVEEVEVGAVRGAVTWADDYLQLSSFALDALTVTNLAYLGPDSSIVVSGSATLTGLAITARINTPLVDAAKPDGERRMSSIEVSHFGIDGISLSGGQGHFLDYQSYASGLRLTLTKGKLGGIYANGITLEFPADAEEGMLVRGDKNSSAGIASAENLQVAARTGSGTFFSGLLNARTLKAEFAESGAIKATLAELSLSGGHLKSGDLDAKLKANGSGLRVSLLPGKHGYGDGSKKLGADELSVRATGKKGKTSFDAEVEKASFEISDDARTTEVSNLLIPSIKLHQFHLANEKFIVDIPAGETVELGGLTMDVTMEKNLAPKSKDEFAYNRILVRNMRIPYLLTRGMDVTLVEKNLTVHLDRGVSGGIFDIYMQSDADHPEGFIIEPNAGWAMLGTVGFTKASLVHLKASIPGVFDAAARVKAEGFSMGFLSDGSQTVDLDQIVATDLDVTVAASDPLKSTKFSTLIGRTKHDLGSYNPGIYAKGVHAKMGKDKDGKDTFEASVDEAGLRGFKVELPESGVTLDIRHLILPQGAQMPSMGNVVVPEAKISDAYFRINDILNMGPPGPKGKPSKIESKLLNFLDTLNGVIDLVIHAPADYLASQSWYVPTLQEDFPLKIYISNGIIDYAKLEDTLLTSTILDQAIDFEMDGDVLYVQIDLKTFGALLGGLLGLGGAAYGGSKATDKIKDKASWKLDPNDPGGNEVEMAEKYDKVRLRTLAKPFLPDGTEKPDDGKKADWGKMLHDFEVRINNVNLSLIGESSIDLGALNKEGLKGTVRLGGVGVNGATALRVSGNSKTGLGLGLDEANVRLEDLSIDTESKHIGVNTGTIRIANLKEASLSFGAGADHLSHLTIMPKQLEGTIGEGSVENLRVNWADKNPAPPKKADPAAKPTRTPSFAKGTKP